MIQIKTKRKIIFKQMNLIKLRTRFKESEAHNKKF